jgi:enediyne biosynthesis protein E4
LNGNGMVEVIEAYFNKSMGQVVPIRNLHALSRVLPEVRTRMPSHAAYANSSVAEILGEHFEKTEALEANWLETTLFLNRGDTFEARALPMKAQFAPVFGMVVGDLDGDGREDLFLSQNFFATQPETGRYDAGRGLWLKGSGTGDFVPVKGHHSGIRVYGEQRGAALADFDGDGRVDLVVTQNGAATKLFRNKESKPGLRVKLQGNEGNPDGIGAQMRLVFAQGRMGPVREVQAGSGYWSQNSATQVLGMPERPEAIWVRWPGGQEMTSKIPQGSAEIRVNLEGTVNARE